MTKLARAPTAPAGRRVREGAGARRAQRPAGNAVHVRRQGDGEARRWQPHRGADRRPNQGRGGRLPGSDTGRLRAERWQPRRRRLRPCRRQRGVVRGCVARQASPAPSHTTTRSTGQLERNCAGLASPTPGPTLPKDIVEFRRDRHCRRAHRRRAGCRRLPAQVQHGRGLPRRLRGQHGCTAAEGRGAPDQFHSGREHWIGATTAAADQRHARDLDPRAPRADGGGGGLSLQLWSIKQTSNELSWSKHARVRYTNARPCDVNADSPSITMFTNPGARVAATRYAPRSRKTTSARACWRRGSSARAWRRRGPTPRSTSRRWETRPRTSAARYHPVPAARARPPCRHATPRCVCTRTQEREAPLRGLARIPATANRRIAE